MNSPRHEPTRPPLAKAAAAAALGGWALPASAQAPQQGGGAGEFLVFMVILFGMMYFLMIRPQVKKAKQHRQMLDALHEGDEIVTNGGLLARIDSIGDNFLTIELGKGVKVKMQKEAVHAVLPKGSMDKL